MVIFTTPRSLLSNQILLTHFLVPSANACFGEIGDYYCLPFKLVWTIFAREQQRFASQTPIVPFTPRDLLWFLSQHFNVVFYILDVIPNEVEEINRAFVLANQDYFFSPVNPHHAAALADRIERLVVVNFSLRKKTTDPQELAALHSLESQLYID